MIHPFPNFGNTSSYDYQKSSLTFRSEYRKYMEASGGAERKQGIL